MYGAMLFCSNSSGRIPRPAAVQNLFREIQCSLDLLSVFLDQTCDLGTTFRWQVDECYAAFTTFAGKQNSDLRNMPYDAFEKSMLKHDSSHGISLFVDAKGVRYFKGCAPKLIKIRRYDSTACTICGAVSDKLTSGVCEGCWKCIDNFED